MAELHFEVKIGAEIATVLPDLAALRIIVFKDFPYLYEGTLKYEEVYLQTYINAPKSFLFAVYDGQKMVGATTCIPLADETLEVKEPFIQAGIDISEVFYFGESILLSAYRGLGLGNRFFEEREAHASGFGNFRSMYFCGVQRAENHPLKPADYKPLDEFWIKRGYKKQSQLSSQFEWLDVGEQMASSKTMLFWGKEIRY